MSVSIVSASVPAPVVIPALEGKFSDRTVTSILVFGGTTAIVMLIAAAVLLQFSLLIAGFAMIGFTALSAIYVYKHNLRVLRSEFRRESHILGIKIDGLKNETIKLQVEINELKTNQITPASLMERLGVLEKEFLNRGRYKYIDETPGEDDVPLPSTAASSAGSPKSSGISSGSLPK